MDSQKKTATSTTESGGSATSSRRATEKPSATTSVARPEPQPTNTPTTTIAQIPTTSTATTASPMIPLSQLELILKQLQPNLDLSKALAGLLQTQQTSLPIAATTTPTTRTTETSTKEQAKAHPVEKPATQPNIPPPPSHSISQALHTDNPPKSATEKATDPRAEEGTVAEQGKGDKGGGH